MIHLIEDIQTIRRLDPASPNSIEIVLTYGGLHAIWLYRIGHRLCRWRLRVLGLMLSYLAKMITGIEIHPSATIGRRFFIDHGSGIVIGGTAVIGDNCTLYQGVTLGGISLDPTKKRHPTLEDFVTVGAGAKILGDIVVGAHAQIGSNAVVTKPVPAGATVIGVPGQVANKTKKSTAFHQYAHDPKCIDPMLQRLNALEKEIKALQAQLKNEE